MTFFHKNWAEIAWLEILSYNEAFPHRDFYWFFSFYENHCLDPTMNAYARTGDIYWLQVQH
jgi:hypothetical protein